jgi:hypothetical protein
MSEVEQTRTIEIDFDVHKRIELARTGFSETPNQVLRRLLEIEGSPPSPSMPSSLLLNKTRGARAWSGKGVTLPHGTELRMEYNGRTHSGIVDDGRWSIDRKFFNSPSAAAGGVGTTKEGKHPSLDGWLYWKVKLPGEHQWMLLAELRRRAGLAGAAGT